jgi:hypothetical protein
MPASFDASTDSREKRSGGTYDGEDSGRVFRRVFTAILCVQWVGDDEE